MVRAVHPPLHQAIDAETADGDVFTRPAKVVTSRLHAIEGSRAVATVVGHHLVLGHVERVPTSGFLELSARLEPGELGLDAKAIVLVQDPILEPGLVDGLDHPVAVGRRIVANRPLDPIGGTDPIGGIDGFAEIDRIISLVPTDQTLAGGRLGLAGRRHTTGCRRGFVIDSTGNIALDVLQGGLANLFLGAAHHEQADEHPGFESMHSRHCRRQERHRRRGPSRPHALNRPVSPGTSRFTPRITARVSQVRRSC